MPSSSNQSSHAAITKLTHGGFEGLLARIIGESSQAVIITEIESDSRRIIHVNPEFERLTGHKHSEVLGHNPIHLLCPPGGQAEWSQLEALLNIGKPIQQPLPTARANRTVFWADCTFFPLKENDGRITHWAGFFFDVTDRLELHESLRRSEAQHRLLAENIRDLISVHRPDGTCSFVSSSCRNLLGYEARDIVGKPLAGFLHPDDQARFRQHLENHFEGREESVLYHQVLRSDGGRVWAETTSKTRRDPISGRPTEVVSTTRDITKRRDAEEKLKAMHRLLDSVYEAVPVGLSLLDDSNHILLCNRAFSDLFSAEPALVAGRSADTFLPAREFARASISQGSPCECECTRPDGSTFHAELTVVSLETGSPHRRLAILADLSERKRIESRLREASHLESLGTFANGIAHDFNNMLAIILGYASLLREPGTDPSRLSHYADTIIDAGRRGADVVRQLQLFANTQDAELASIDVHALLEETINRVCAGWPAEIRIVRAFDAANAHLTADPIQLTQAIQKLLENSREAMSSDGGQLIVRTSEIRQAVFSPGTTTSAETKSFLRLSIEDSGRGMDAATRARMFEPFFARNKSPEVHGLGLAVVYGIMRAHRGLIEVDSAPGRGTSVHLLFPRAELKIEQPSTPPPEPVISGGKRRTILLVEDEQDIGSLWLELLPTDGWHVLWARDGGEAVRLYRAHRDEIALVFSDIGLPVMDGWQVTEIVRTESPGMPLLIASGAFRPGDRQRGLAEPVAYLSKPYVPTQVLRQIRSLALA